MIALKATGIERLQAALGSMANRLPNELATAVNATAKATARVMAKDIVQELAVTQKVVTKTIRQTRKASKAQMGAVIELSKTSRISLKEFGARQTKKGVSYRISRREGRKVVAGAFQGPKPGVINTKWKGTVFIREYRWQRLPIKKLQGPSPWGVHVKKKLTPQTLAAAEKELEKQVERRIQFALFRSGQL